MSLPIIPDSDSPCNLFPRYFSIAGHAHKLYSFDNVYYIRNMTRNTREIIYGAAPLDYFLHTLEVAGERLYRQWWAAAQTLRAIAAMRPIPRMLAVRKDQPELTPPSAPAAVSLIDVTFCEACGNDIPDAALCPVCAKQSAMDMQVQIGKIKPFTPRNARTGREVHTTNQQIAADLMAQYPDAKTPSEAAQMRLNEHVAKLPPIEDRKPAVQPQSTRFAPVQKAAGF